MLFHNLHRMNSMTQRVASPANEQSDFYFSQSPRTVKTPPPNEREQSTPDLANLRTKVSLTRALFESCPNDFKKATECNFLRHAGQGKVNKTLLSRWLSQDRLYAETYICFVSSLLARVTLPYAFVSDKDRSLRWRLIRMLTSALENIHRELDFFTATAQRYGLQLDLPPADDAKMFGPATATEQYMDLFRGFFLEPSTSLLEGLVVLWGTEQCYLSAWTYAARFQEETTEVEGDEDGGALRQDFIPNWTSAEFHDFVNEIAELTDALAEREKATRKLEVYKAVWLHLLDIERRFWPDVKDTDVEKGVGRTHTQS